MRNVRVLLEWGPVGAAAVAEGAEVAVVIDVLSFTTTLSIAVEQGSEVFPYPWQDESAPNYARSRSATLAVGRFEATTSGRPSLSPAGLREVPAPPRLVLPSPNGSAISFRLAASGARVLAACLRNRSAVAGWLREHVAGSVAVVAAGERWADGSLRPAVEDFWGAGAVIAALEEFGAAVSPEARSAAAAFRCVQGDPLTALRECRSGRELTAAAFGDDVAVAAELDVSGCVPVLVGERFVTAGG